MERHDLAHLETKIKELHANLTNLADGRGCEEFITIIHKPGFTSVAEHSLLGGVVDSMLEQAKTLLGQQYI
jgi:hypothetical protein